MQMNSKTFNRRYDTLLRDISIHPHKDEILHIMYHQLQDENADTVKPTKLTKLTHS